MHRTARSTRVSRLSASCDYGICYLVQLLPEQEQMLLFHQWFKTLILEP